MLVGATRRSRADREVRPTKLSCTKLSYTNLSYTNLSYTKLGPTILCALALLLGACGGKPASIVDITSTEVTFPNAPRSRRIT